ncbi:Uncharacterized protein APZ42_006923, partial [Daphnia magna]
LGVDFLAERDEISDCKQLFGILQFLLNRFHIVFRFEHREAHFLACLPFICLYKCEQVISIFIKNGVEWLLWSTEVDRLHCQPHLLGKF